MNRVAAFSRGIRRRVGRIGRELFPSPELSAWKRACALADRTPRRTPGVVDLAGYRVSYLDLMTVVPQWHDIFLQHRLRFRADTEAPRILDCGANVGLATLYLKRLYPRARVTAFEADPRLADLLRLNLSANGALDVEVVGAAVWTADGTARFAGAGDDSGSLEGLAPGQPHVSDFEVRTIRLRDRIAAEPIDLLKIDIEGAEAAVLGDCADVLPNVRAIIAEIHEFDPARRVTPSILGILRDAGFVVAIDEHLALTWREPVAGADTPFPGTALAWVTQVKGWRASSAHGTMAASGATPTASS